MSIDNQLPTVDVITLFKEQVKTLIKPLPTTDENLSHIILGLLGESGEFADCIKKAKIYNKLLDVENLIEESGDILFYLEACKLFIPTSQDGTATLVAPISPDPLVNNAISLGILVNDFIQHIIENRQFPIPLEIAILKNISSSLNLVGTTLDVALQHNLDKLSKRYSSGSYSDEQAQARADKAK